MYIETVTLLSVWWGRQVPSCRGQYGGVGKTSIACMSISSGKESFLYHFHQSSYSLFYTDTVSPQTATSMNCMHLLSPVPITADVDISLTRGSRLLETRSLYIARQRRNAPAPTVASLKPTYLSEGESRGHKGRLACVQASILGRWALGSWSPPKDPKSPESIIYPIPNGKSFTEYGPLPAQHNAYHLNIYVGVSPLNSVKPLLIGIILG